MRGNLRMSWMLCLINLITCVTVGCSPVYQVKGSFIQLNCSLRGSVYRALSWGYSAVYPTILWTYFTVNEYIKPKYPRLNLTGNFNNGEYNLVINNLVKEDKGYYQCFLSGTNNEVVQQLVVIDGPTSVAIQKSDNKVVGTEGQSIQLTCTAVGGDPAPEVQILRSGFVVSHGKQTVTYIIPTLQRSDDGQTVTCTAGYNQINSFPKKDQADIYLNLKPYAPEFSKDSLSVIEGSVIDTSCTSTGSRPAAVFNWYIDGANITDSSAITSSTSDQSTFTVTSRLRLTSSKDHNGEHLTCKAINIAAPNGVEPAVPITVDVKYPPTVTVNDNTVTDDTSPVVMTCRPDGNPDTYTFYEWAHESLQGTFIRRLTGTSDGTLTLPNVDRAQRFQNTGRYICTVGNGIPDTGTRRAGSGVLTVNAPPVLAFYNSWTQGGEIRKTVNISVDVYSVPPPNFEWYREETRVSGSGYKTSSLQTVVKVMFHGQIVKVSGYRATLTIVDVKESDFTSYKIRVINSHGSVEQGIQLNPGSPPDTPKSLIVICQTDHSLTVQWLAGYDGGYEQTFYIMYTQQGTVKWTTLMGPDGVRGGTGQIHQTVLAGLKHSTVYELKMFAQNQINRSNETMVQVGTTISTFSASYVSSLKMERDTLVGAVAGISVVTVISIVIILILVYKFVLDRRTHTRLHRDQPSIEAKDLECYDNIPEATAEIPLADNSNYETLESKDKPNVYEDIGQDARGAETKVYSNTLI